ncbi:hypothetical protein [Halosegnis marinus]|uniref:Uncharacterized protein n=1 Tax=Halosegnis marinus TaxID=3034023 RepID=A0ABD5ZPI8_9EURY|nr:hypothetical protein [Halosegnis sp. DT85]
MEQSYREVARERVRTPQAYLAPVVAALVVWLAVVASNVVYVAGGVLLLATVVAVSVDGVSPQVVEERLYPGVAATLLGLGAVAAVTGPTDGYVAAGAVAATVGTGLLLDAAAGEQLRSGVMLFVATVAALGGAYFVVLRGLVVPGGVLFLVAAGALGRSGVLTREKLEDDERHADAIEGE